MEIDYTVILIILAALVTSGLAIKQNNDAKKSEKEVKDLNAQLIESQQENLKYALGSGHGTVRVWANNKDSIFKSTYASLSNYPMLDPEIYAYSMQDFKETIVHTVKDTVYVDHNKYDKMNKLIYSNNVVKANKAVDLSYTVEKPSESEFICFNMDYRHGHYLQLTMLINMGMDRDGIVESTRVYSIINGKWELLYDEGVPQPEKLWNDNFFIGKVIHAN